MSPTGKAASRLSEQTGRKASTIHRAVFSNALYDKEVIIIDEASMLSVPLCDMLISCELLSTARILLVGDSAQIPSIGLGRIFKDMGQSGVIPTCTLTRCFRFDEGGASYISTLTRQGKFYMTDEQLRKDRFTLGERQDYEFIKFNGKVEQIIDTYMSLINQGVKPEEIMVLVPYNIGQYGATKINNLIQEKLNPVGNDLMMKTKHNDIEVKIHQNDLVMNIKNNYNALSYQAYDESLWDDDMDIDECEPAQVFNGQIGKVQNVINDTQVLHTKFLVAHIEGEDIIYTQGDINNLLLAYCSNPYKYQGSQCKYVINVVIGAHERVWNRNLLYTAQTRMTTKLIEIGDINVIKEAVGQTGDDNRKTRLIEFLTEK
jgi:exodeoxyribonuclease V alpha subunit